MRQRLLIATVAGALTAAAALPVAASAEQSFHVFVDAVCYDGHGQVMDQSEGYPTLGHWIEHWAETNRNLDPLDAMDGICTEPLHVFSISLVREDGSHVLVLYE